MTQEIENKPMETAEEKTEKVRPRIRSLFGKFILYGITVIAFMIAMIVPFSAIFSLIYGSDFLNNDFTSFCGGTPVLLFLVAMYFSIALSAYIVSKLFRKKIDKRPFNDIGLYGNNKLRKLGIGMIAGIAVISVGFVMLTITGFVRIESLSFDPMQLILGLVIMLLVGFGEELIFRAYILSSLLEKMSLKWSIVISAIMFTVVHSINPNLYIPGMVTIFIYGIFSGIYYHKTKDLWFIIGLHATWNFSMGFIYGFGVSGTDNAGIFNIALNGPKWINGGSFGFEGSILAPIILIASTYLIQKYHDRIAPNEKS